MTVLSVHQATVRWPDEERGPWTAVFTWANSDGTALLVGVDLHGFDGSWRDLGRPWAGTDQPSPAELKSEVWRSIPLGQLADRAYEQVVEKFIRHSAHSDPALDAKGIVGVKRGGRPPLYDREHFVEVARVYREAKDRRRPTEAVAEHFGVSKSAAAKWIARASIAEFRLL